jgi:hypothetical protein
MTKKEKKEQQRIQDRVQEFKILKDVIKEKAENTTDIKLRDELYLTWDSLCDFIYNLEKYGQEMRPIRIFDENGKKIEEHYDNGKIVYFSTEGWDGNFRELY